jgi:nitroreductase/NAD-dependent dihydropyrimidine dehydrogenase PreA subunit
MTSLLSIDERTCTHCNACVRDCPTSALRERTAQPPELDRERCIGCGHCGALCGPGAVRSTDGPFDVWSQPQLDVDAIKAFLSGRRSTRRYRRRPIDPAQLSEVLDVARFAPSASNARDVHLTVFTGSDVFALAKAINDYYLGLARLLGTRWLWPLLYFTEARPYLTKPEKLRAIRDRAQRFDEDHDWLFFSAPAVVLLSAPRRNARFGATNCVIAAERMMQFASALALGSCYIGYAEVALRRKPSLAQGVGLPKDHVVHSVFALGHSAIEYRRLPARAPLPTRFDPLQH